MAKPKNPIEVETLRAEVAALTAERDALRVELAEWRKATMLENQDTATPEHLRLLIQDMGDALERARASVRHCNGCSKCQGEAPTGVGEYNPLGVVRGSR